jgi:preprotein translocase subunit YajC
MPESPAAAPGPLAMLFPFAIMFAIFYLIVFRPQAKAQKQHAQMLKNLKKNDEVVTSGGLIGTVVNVKPDAITLRIDDNVRVEVERSAITRVRTTG